MAGYCTETKAIAGFKRKIDTEDQEDNPQEESKELNENSSSTTTNECMQCGSLDIDENLRILDEK